MNCHDNLSTRLEGIREGLGHSEEVAEARLEGKDRDQGKGRDQGKSRVERCTSNHRSGSIITVASAFRSISLGGTCYCGLGGGTLAGC